MFAMKFKTIGTNILLYRKERGYTQEVLAEKAGISTSYLGQIERGNKGKSFAMETLFAIAKALEVEPEELIKKKI